MICNLRLLPLLGIALAALAGCSSKSTATDAKKAAVPLDKIVGKAQVIEENGGATDEAISAGSRQSWYIWEGGNRYRLFVRKPLDLIHGDQYVVEGIYAQKLIEEIGDPDQGKNGYPLESSCEKVVQRAWGNSLAFDAIVPQGAVLRSKVKRYPARAVFLVTRIRAATDADLPAGATGVKKDEAKDKKVTEVTVPAEKQAALLVEGSPTQPAPLWEPNGGTVRCKVCIGTDGKMDELETGKQLCEAVRWNQFRWQPPVQGGKPVKVSTEVEIRFEPRK